MMGFAAEQIQRPLGLIARLLVVAALLVLALNVWFTQAERDRSINEDRRQIAAHQALVCAIGDFLVITRQDRAEARTLTPRVAYAYIEIFRDLDRVDCPTEPTR
jgi:hypothetical protein